MCVPKRLLVRWRRILTVCQRNRENENINHVNQKWFSHWSYHICLEGDGSGLSQGRSGNRVAGRVSRLPSRCTLAFFYKGRALIFFRWDTSWPDDDLHAQCCHWAGLSACMLLIQINCRSWPFLQETPAIFCQGLSLPMLSAVRGTIRVIWVS